ncbi:uncharacterized protein B0J16DRAFT_417933 [Fusarium flagelliforme]|uniref:Uncharacterized protein n=1 Tax=Fusarium flagelliforme TaxID=2675880 RepID=A0A395MH14_9HYPO|nr:uncharacterized protein B0J16DRAFT_417933 [Fusarium flagelliforme]KAH7174425.1 hypothetical protein B0J16DRAFT_417933 [Fusarium flagelliforme]RFN47136.1 hypothetical protein FIE12Z_8592 [Fusarium flagelliforme]
MVHYMFLTPPHTVGLNYRWMMFAPDGETIDKWWRNVSESSLANQVKRISPDFYSLTAFVGGPNNMFEIPWKFVPSMDAETSWFLISDYNNKLAMPYVQPSRVDVRSGDSYYIRSKSRPDYFWTVAPYSSYTLFDETHDKSLVDERQPMIWASDKSRTRFIIHLDGQEGTGNRGTVIINKDPITLTAAVGNHSQHVSVNNHNMLILGGDSGRLYYGQLKNRFLAQSGNLNYSAAIVTENTDAGEEWELVK